jgi:ADP-ribosyl-[dinitrogen reductase] hydrolase
MLLFMPLTRRERIEGGILGALTGDAMGVPYEFKAGSEIPNAAGVDMTPPPGFDRSHGEVPPGTWSDDGSLTLALLETLLHNEGRFDADDFGGRLVAWRREGRLAVDGRVFDVGVQTDEAIKRIAGGTPAAGAGPSGELSNGNGALMRTLPVALAAKGDDRTLIDVAHRQSRTTHGHVRSEICCALYALWTRRLLDDRGGDPWRDAVATLRAVYSNDAARKKELDEEVRPDVEGPGGGTAYVVDALRSARWCFLQGSYEDVVKAAIRLGNDTDTTASIAGGAAGLRDGRDAIPRRWRDALRGAEIYRPILDSLLAFDGRASAASGGSSAAVSLF